MARSPDSRVEEAHKLFNQGKKLIEIAQHFGISEGTVRSWKSRGKWGIATLQNGECNVAKRKRGGQPGNRNSVGNAGGGAPKRNKNAEKFGFLSKWLPPETKEIMEMAAARCPLDLLGDQIQIAYAAIIRAQQIAFVEDKYDKTIEKVGQKDGETMTAEEWEVQQAWDKHNAFMKSQATAQARLSSMIKQYDEMLHKDWDLYTEEQKARIKLITAKIDGEGEETEDDGFMDALAGKVADVWQDN